MKKLAIGLLAATAMGIYAAGAQTAESIVEQKDPAVTGLVPANAQVEKLAEADGFFEGPVWLRGQGRDFLVFSDVTGNRINKLDANGTVSPYVDTVFTGKDTSSVISFERNGKRYIQPGPNGTTMDSEGRLVFCAMGSGKIMRLEANGTRTILAGKYNGRHLNAPNDLVYKSDGALYFTDIRAGLVTTDETPPEGVPHTGVYRMEKDGKLTLLVSNLEAPNGIAFSPDEKYLYVNDIRTRKLMRYDVQVDGTVANGRVFMDMTTDTRVGNPDGMKIDSQGNIWDGGPGGVWIISPEGKHLGILKTPERISNMAWGTDGKTLYMTGPTQLFRVRVNVAGYRP